MIIELAAYDHCAKCCGRANQPTASGRWPIVGRTIAAPRHIPFGTRVKIKGIGWVEVMDRTRKDIDGWDWFRKSHWAAKQWGRRNVEVLAIEYPKPRDS